jgi:hypothetical protein
MTFVKFLKLLYEKEYPFCFSWLHSFPSATNAQIPDVRVSLKPKKP